MGYHFFALAATMLLALPARGADPGNRLAYLDEPPNPYYLGLSSAKLVTPQWIGEDGVEFVIVLAIDDLSKPPVYEKFLRPVFERLKRIDGRAAVSIMTTHVDPTDPQLQVWLKEGVNLETHTYDHPCPCLELSNFEKAKSTFDRSIDLVATIPNARPVAFRMPCCDSMNSASPRFYAEIFNKTTPAGRFLAMDSSIFMLFSADDPALPRELALQDDHRPRFAKYVPADRQFINYVENYPYPYVIGKLCWEMPSPIPDDWLGNNLNKPLQPATVRDMKAAIDATAIKQGVFTLTFHPHTHNWILNTQVVELIDHAAGRYGKKVKVLNFREVLQRLTQNALGGQPLRAANGQDNGVRVLDLNNDGYMDVVIGNQQVHQTRLWSPEKKKWIVSDFPVDLVSVDPQGNRRDAGVRFGVLDKSGRASMIVRNEKVAGTWHFDGTRWVVEPNGLRDLDWVFLKRRKLTPGPVYTSLDGRDRGVRLRDLNRDGICELLVGNEKQNAVFAWTAKDGAWRRLPFQLPRGTAIVDAQGRDAGFRLVDIDGDGSPDVVFSNAQRYSLDIFIPPSGGWVQRMASGTRSDPGAIPMIVRADGSNNGTWFKYDRMWVQNEDSGRDIQIEGKKVRIPSEGRTYKSFLKAVAVPAADRPSAQSPVTLK
jgi:hypothetical protein